MSSTISTIDLGSVVTTSAAKQIAENIHAAILDGKLKVDVRLPSEDELAAQFKVSRPTIREALKRLAAQNLVRSRRGPTGGNFITSPPLSEAGRSLANTTTLMVAVGDLSIEDMITTRLEVETSCCRLACDHRTNLHLEEMRLEIETQKNAALTDQEFCASDVRFHRTVADASGNSLLRLLMYSVVEGLQPISNMIIYRVRERQMIVAFHTQLYDAIYRRKKGMGSEALSKLTTYTRERLAEALEKRA